MPEGHDAATEKKPAVSRDRTRPPLAVSLVFAAGRVVSPPIVHILDAAGGSIGRDSEARIALRTDARVSRRHASWRWRQGDLFFADAGSVNGTFVGGESITKEVRVARGDVIAVGDSCFVVAEDPRQEPDAPATRLLGTAASIRRLRSEIAELAPKTDTVLVTGETGCGKEVVAAELHAQSGRRGDFVPVDCGALPENLAESLLFGQAAGAFTGALNKTGFFQSAEHGTLFLDEIGNAPLGVQAKLLRVLEDKCVTRLGTTKAVPCDVRVVAATNIDLVEAIAKRTFKPDLYQRLHQSALRIPPLRDRREDIVELFVSAMPRGAPPPTFDFVHRLLRYDWPGNVRELFAITRDVVVRGRGCETLDVAHLEARLASATSRITPPPAESAGEPSDPQVPVTRDALVRRLEENGGVVTKTAEDFQRTSRQVHRWIKTLGIDLAPLRPKKK